MIDFTTLITKSMEEDLMSALFQIELMVKQVRGGDCQPSSNRLIDCIVRLGDGFGSGKVDECC